MIATDNLDLGCTIFEKAATEKAIREIDERLVQQYNNRSKAKGSNQPFFDQSQLHGRFPMHLPDSLKPKPGHLNPAQQRVYEDFARIPRGAAGAHAAVGGGKPMASMEKVSTTALHPVSLQRVSSHRIACSLQPAKIAERVIALLGTVMCLHQAVHYYTPCLVVFCKRC